MSSGRSGRGGGDCQRRQAHGGSGGSAGVAVAVRGACGESVCAARAAAVGAVLGVPATGGGDGQCAEGKHAGAQCDGGGEAPVAGESTAGRAGGGAEQCGDVSDRPEGLREGPRKSQLRAAVSVSGGEGEGAAGVCELRRMLPQRVSGAAADGVLGSGADQDVRVLESGEGIRVPEVLQR